MFLFADDSKSRAHSLRLLQADVDRCVEWAAKNGMTFNTKKTVFAHFANKHTLLTPHFLKLGDHIVPDSTTVKDLGLIVDNTLNWKSHITAKIKSCYNIFYSLRRVIPFSTPLATKVQVIKAYILSSLCYLSPIWYPSRTELKSMDTLLSRVTKWITVGSYSERLQKCFLMPISLYLEYLDLTFFNALLSGKQDIQVWNFVSLRYYSRYSLRSSEKPVFNVNKTYRASYDQWFFNRVVRSANKLHEKTDISLFDSQISFKRRLKHFFLNNDWF